MNRLRSASRYATTYLVLLQQFAAERGWRFGVLLLAVLANAFVHPIPFLLIAEILRSTQAGADKIALGWGGLSFSVQPDLGVLAVFLIGAGSFLLSYGVSRLVGREIVAWQSAMFWRLLGQAGRLARWDRTFELGAILQPHPIAAKLDGALRGAFPIGRLIETGSRDFVMILVLGAMLVWQDPRDTLVLGLLSLLFLPAYAIALSRLVKMQSKSNAQHGRLLRPVAEILSSDITRRSGQRLDTKTMPSSATSALARGFGSQSHLLNEQNAVTVVAGVHVFAAFYGVYLSEGQSLATLPAAKLSSLFFLVLLLRSLTGLIGLISRLSRGYERLGQLRALLFPAAKPQVAADQQRLGQFNFSGSFESYSGAMPAGLGPGQCLLYLAPDISYEFQLLPLSNALCPSFAPTPTITRHIPLIGVDEVPALLDGGIVAGTAQQLKLTLAGNVPLLADPVDLGQAPVVALRPAAWQQLVQQGRLSEAGRGRVLVLTAQGRIIPAPTPPEALVALSDGQRLIAAGDQAAIKQKLLSLAIQPAAAKPIPEDEEEPGIGVDA